MPDYANPQTLISHPSTNFAASQIVVPANTPIPIPSNGFITIQMVNDTYQNATFGVRIDGRFPGQSWVRPSAPAQSATNRTLYWQQTPPIPVAPSTAVTYGFGNPHAWATTSMMLSVVFFPIRAIPFE